jgi:hypothetical protein
MALFERLHSWVPRGVRRKGALGEIVSSDSPDEGTETAQVAYNPML